MRFLVIAIAAALLLPPAIAPAEAHDAAQHSAKAAATDFSAKKHQKPMKKTAKAKK
jgi:hypothetical protein